MSVDSVSTGISTSIRIPGLSKQRYTNGDLCNGIVAKITYLTLMVGTDIANRQQAGVAPRSAEAANPGQSSLSRSSCRFGRSF